MATFDDYLSNAMGALSVDDSQWKELDLDNNIRTQLIKIEIDYDSIFSWDIQRLTGISLNYEMNLIDTVGETQEPYIDEEFNLTRFYLQLIACYELYNSKSYKESYDKIESVVKFMETCTFDESDQQYSDAYCHIARSTNAYIALTLKIHSEELLKDIKPINSLNQSEKAAICAVKARVFMQYYPKGNDIALKFADQACSLESNKPEWLIVWLKAKGRVRRYHEQYQMPDDDEIDAAEMLYSTQTKSHFLIAASKVYMEAANVHKLKNNKADSNKLYKISSDIIKNSIELAKDDTKQLYPCLLTCIRYPKEFFSKWMIKNIIEKLSNVKSFDQVLGKYYYEKTKTLLSIGMDNGYFDASLLLIKIQCLLQPVSMVPLVQTLNMMYDVYPNCKKRLIILSQILMYYNYCDNNPEEMMRYLQLYIDQDIEDTFKKHNLIYVQPLFKVDGFKPQQFLNILYLNVKGLLNHKWSIEEKKVIDNTFDRFDKISKLYIDEHQFINDNDDNIRVEANSNRYSYNELYNKKKNESWRKLKVELSENGSIKNQQHQSASKCIYQRNYLEKQSIPGIEPPTSQHKVIVNNFKLPINNFIKSVKMLKHSNGVESKLTTFENRFNSSRNVHISLEKNSTNNLFGSRMCNGHNYKTSGNKPSWRHKQDDIQIQDNTFEIFNKGGIQWHPQHSRGYNNTDYLKNQQDGNPKRVYYTKHET